VFDKKQLRIYTDDSLVVLRKDKQSPRSNIKGIIDFVHYLRYRNSLPGTYLLKAKKFKELKNHFISQYQVIEASGGVVMNQKNEVLLIFRRGFWDLPKGKLEKGESKKECAVREVIEECGIENVEITKKLALHFNGKKTTYHTYRYKNKPTIKPSHWYMMKTKKQKLIPQTSEDITKAIWVKVGDLPSYYEGAYPAIRDIFETVNKQFA